METDPDQQAVFFDATLYPHRSLSIRGFYILIGLVGIVSFVAGIVFTLLGAWPVMGFFGLDVLLVYAAFRLNYRAARMSERIRLTDDQLRIQRCYPNGQVEDWSYDPYWVRIQTEMDHAGNNVSLTFSSHGRDLSIGNFLNAEEREALAAAIRDALARQRQAQLAQI